MNKRISVSFKNEDKNLLSKIKQTKKENGGTYSDIIKKLIYQGTHTNRAVNNDTLSNYLNKYHITKNEAIKILHNQRVHNHKAKIAGLKLNHGHIINHNNLIKAVHEIVNSSGHINKSAIMRKYNVSSPSLYRALRKYRSRQK